MKKIILAPLFILLSLFCMARLDIINDVSQAIRSGNAHEIAKYFSSNVDLTILSEEEIYSKAQAEQVLQDFLNKNTPRSFTLLHQGSKPGAKYAIGTYINTQGVSYRVYFFIKQSGTSELIQDLRFEKN